MSEQKHPLYQFSTADVTGFSMPVASAPKSQGKPAQTYDNTSEFSPQPPSQPTFTPPRQIGVSAPPQTSNIPANSSFAGVPHF